ncbi:NU4LM oxidoreductase, partial [Semnornis frantzii]|nr:NU4LM oxidoreductase [Semnornis frantzii]
TSFMHLRFYSAFALSCLGLAFHQAHLISALLCLESIILSIYTALSTWPAENLTTSSSLTPLLALAFSAC